MPTNSMSSRSRAELRACSGGPARAAEGRKSRRKGVCLMTLEQEEAGCKLREPERREVVFQGHKTGGRKDFQKESGPHVLSESHLNAPPPS